MPVFSIILPTYNRAGFLNRSIKSVLSQTFSDFELIVIDDASTDNTKEIVEGFQDKRIRYIRNEINLERSTSRNKGIDLAKGEYICFLDSDDAFRKEHLQAFYEFIQNNNNPKAFIFTGFQRNYSNGETEELLRYPNKNENIIEWLIQEQLPPPSTVCIHHEILAKHKFDKKFVINEDVDLWARIVLEYPFFLIEKITLDFFIHDNNTKFINKDPNYEQLRVLKNFCKNPVFKNHISIKFKNERIKSLKAQRIKAFADNNHFDKINFLIIEYLFRYPFSAQNKYRLYLLLSNLPIAKFLVKKYSNIKNK